MGTSSKYSFAELEQNPNTTAQQLAEALDEYAYGGWAILPRCVIGIYQRVKGQVTPDLHQQMTKACGHGAANNRREVSRSEYREVLNYLKANG